MKVLITGTSSGIGRAIACRFLDCGHEVIGFDVEKSSIENPHYRHFICDVRDEKSYPDINDVEILINNAGVQNKDDINVNLLGAMKITERYGIHEGIVSILNIASSSAHNGAEFPEYSVSKGGLLTYTKNVALRVAKYGATCNSLSPGGVITELNRPVMEDPGMWKQIMDLTPLKKWATAEEIADWAYFMTAVNRSASGQDILIDNLEMGNATFVWPD